MKKVVSRDWLRRDRVHNAYSQERVMAKKYDTCLESNCKPIEGLKSKKAFTFGKHQELEKICSPYIERERSFLNNEEKADQREMISSFFLENHQPLEKIRLLSLPSIHWSFEHLLVSKSPERDYRFFGLEHVWGVLELGQPYMPGGKSISHVLTFPIGEIRGFITLGLKNGGDGKLYSQFLWVDAASFLCITNRERGTSGQSIRFARVYKRMSCIWLDFQSQISSKSVREAINHAPSFFNKGRKSCPIAITVMAARDIHDGDIAREEDICDILNENPYREFLMETSFRYVNNGIPMLNVLGHCLLRS